MNHLRGRIAELRRYPIKQDTGDVGWLADPDAQAQVAEVRLIYTRALPIREGRQLELTPPRQILTQHQVALEGLTGLLSRMEFDEGVITKGLSELGDARH